VQRVEQRTEIRGGKRLLDQGFRSNLLAEATQKSDN
jgi:hypothetical protein